MQTHITDTRPDNSQISAQTSRRDVLGAIASAPVAVLAQPASATQASVDAELERQFAMWRKNLLAIKDSEEDWGRPDADFRLWRIVDTTEDAIVKCDRKSVRVAEMRLWIALQHMSIGSKMERAVIAGDLDTIAAHREELDWPERTVAEALIALVAVGKA